MKLKSRVPRPSAWVIAAILRGDPSIKTWYHQGGQIIRVVVSARVVVPVGAP